MGTAAPLDVPNWLWRTICSVVGAVAVLTVAQWANCAFIVAPRAWPLYEKHANSQSREQVASRPPACRESESSSVAVLMALLTTLISLSRGMDERDKKKR